MNLSAFAPEEFKEHLKVLDIKAQFYYARKQYELGSSGTQQHYVLTGNEGLGIEEAVQAIFDRVKEVSDIDSIIEKDAISMFDTVTGFDFSFGDFSNEGILLHIKNAEKLGMRGSNNTKSGLEVLCNKMLDIKNSIIVLSGKRRLLLEMIQGHENARDLFSYVFHFEDLTPEAMFEYMEDYINSKNYLFDPAAETAFKDYLGVAYKMRGTNFRNALFLQEMFEKEIVPKMSERVISQNENLEESNLCTIMPEDLPELKQPNTEEAIKKLEMLVGLDEVKKQILDHTALVKLNRLRASKGLYNKMPPMHMVFTGNPGTGKTTIAKHVGEIYHSIGVLSSGHVVETERTKLVGEFIGETEKNTKNAINSASGGVLFIDEAYNLFVESNDRKDFGMRVIETLLTYLGNDDTDMIVILAGYTEEMNKMLEANPGMKSRFPYVFHFEDYPPEQLMLIGKKVLENEHYTITPEAERKLAKYIIHVYDHKDAHFGNGRFITRLITTHIIPSLSQRLLTKPMNEISMEEMTTIEECDIPEVKSTESKPREMDETILTATLDTLNGLVGLQNAKQALNDYVDISRLSHQQGTLKITPKALCWDFIGKTGTGKSTVATILGKLLQGLGILRRGQIVSVKADELIGEDCYKVLGRAVKDARDGLLFLDMDAPNIKNTNFNLRLWIINRLRELKQTTAVVIAQVKAPEDMIAQNLATNGIASYGHYIVFNDFTVKELTDILECQLKNEYELEMQPDAKKHILQYIESIKANETKDSPVNARTIIHLAQTIAHITQIRVVKCGSERSVTSEDVVHFKWDKRVKGTVGFV